MACWKEAKDLIVPFAGIDGRWIPSELRIEQLKDQGFVGLKFIIPSTTYHDKSLYPWYEAAQRLNMPIVFHTGIVGRWSNEPVDFDNNFMRPIYLDSIARRFPKLQVIGAHLGNPWWDEAAMSCRWNPNLYFDLSGGTIIKKPASFIDELLWWGRGDNLEYVDSLGRGAFEKILFGSDVMEKDVPEVVERYLKMAESIQMSQKEIDAVFYNNAAAILREAGVDCDE